MFKNSAWLIAIIVSMNPDYNGSFHFNQRIWVNGLHTKTTLSRLIVRWLVIMRVLWYIVALKIGLQRRNHLNYG